MKQFFSYALAGTLLVSFPFTSCKKDSNSSNNSNLKAGQSLITANISGAYSGNYSSANAMSQATKASGIIALTTSTQPSATNLNIDQFIIYLPSNIQVGTYKATDFSGAVFTYTHTVNMSEPRGWQADSDGETVFNFQVTKVSETEIEGTFDGQMTNDEDNTTITAKGTFAGKF